MNDRSTLREGEIQDYVSAFQRSSDRARYALYIVTITTVLIAIANYNVQTWAWPLHRLRSWYAVNESGVDPFFGNHKQLQHVQEEYAKQFAARSVLTSSPIPGVSIDVNDVGIIGGIALVLLMLVQRLCIVREHENLFLALYKVRRLCPDRDDGRNRGESDANRLYHALAMSQVISSPPTLARWQRRGILSHLNLVFYLPVAIYTWVLIGNYLTVRRAELYGVNVIPLLVAQTLILALMVGLATSSWLHSKAMSMRWERAFFRVNPQLRLIDQPTQRAWLKQAKPGFLSIVKNGWIQPHTPAHLASDLLDNVAIKQMLPEAESTTTAEVPVHASIDSTEVNAMLCRLFGSGLQAAMIWCTTHDAELERLTRFVPTVNELEDASWRVEGVWRFTYKYTKDSRLRP